MHHFREDSAECSEETIVFKETELFFSDRQNYPPTYKCVSRRLQPFDSTPTVHAVTPVGTFVAMSVGRQTPLRAEMVPFFKAGIWENVGFQWWRIEGVR